MRQALAVALTGVLMAAVVSPVAADSRSERSSRLEARNARARIEERLAQLQISSRIPEIEYSTPYLPYVEGDRGVDQRIRRLGELIRRQQSEQQP